MATVEHPRTHRIVNLGFVTALVISVLLLLISAGYLFVFLWNTTGALQALLQRSGDGGPGTPNVDALSASYAYTAIAFNSCGIIVGIALAFLGLALFLIGVRGEMDAEGAHESFSFKIARMSPGALSILCSVVILVVCIVTRPTLTFGDRPEARVRVQFPANEVSVGPKGVEAPSEPGGWFEGASQLEMR